MSTPLEVLEQKQLLSGVTSSFSSGTLIINGTSSDDDILVSESTAGTIQYDDGGTITDTGIASANVTKIDLRGLAGNDTLQVDAALTTIAVLRGSTGNDTLIAGGGNSTLYGETGDDVLIGGPGDDTLSAWFGTDSLSGGGGNDLLYVDEFDSHIDGGEGADLGHGAHATAGLNINMASLSLERFNGTAYDDIIDASGTRPVTCMTDWIDRSGKRCQIQMARATRCQPHSRSQPTTTLATSRRPAITSIV